jgi:hemerythrin
MTIVWRDGLSVGNEIIDNDHKRLIGIINSAERVINESGSRRELERILQALDEYAHEHFAREERLQKNVGYPFRETHVLEHKALVQRLQKIRGRVTGAKDPYAYEQALSGLCELLENWLMNHVITHDLRMRPYVEKTDKRAAAQHEYARLGA